jgi:hypothetical protein
MDNFVAFIARVAIAAIASLIGVLAGRLLRKTLPTNLQRVVRLTLAGTIIGVGASLVVINLTGAGSLWIGSLVGAALGFLLYMFT